MCFLLRSKAECWEKEKNGNKNQKLSFSEISLLERDFHIPCKYQLQTQFPHCPQPRQIPPYSPPQRYPRQKTPISRKSSTTHLADKSSSTPIAEPYINIPFGNALKGTETRILFASNHGREYWKTIINYSLFCPQPTLYFHFNVIFLIWRDKDLAKLSKLKFCNTPDHDW